MDTISPELIEEIIRECLFNEDEIEAEKPKDGLVMVVGKGILGNFGFHSERLQARREEVSQMLDLIPDQFHEGKGRGWSFLNMCMDKNDRQWGEHRDMDHLICLGVALGLMKVCEFPPREICPGGMPYIQILHPKEEAKKEG